MEGMVLKFECGVSPALKFEWVEGDIWERELPKGEEWFMKGEEWFMKGELPRIIELPFIIIELPFIIIELPFIIIELEKLPPSAARAWTDPADPASAATATRDNSVNLMTSFLMYGRDGH